MSGAQLPVGGDDAGGTHFDPHLSRPGLRVGHSNVLQHIWTAKFLILDSLHCFTSQRRVTMLGPNRQIRIPGASRRREHRIGAGIKEGADAFGRACAADRKHMKISLVYPAE